MTASGTVFLAAAGGSGRVRPARPLERVPGIWVTFFTVGDTVYGRTLHGLRVSHDQGTTWHRVALPGR